MNNTIVAKIQYCQVYRLF